MHERKIAADQYNRYYEFLTKLDLFAGLKLKDIKNLLPLLQEVSIQGDEILIQEGEEDYSMYILIYGRLQVVVGNPYTPIAEITPGDVVGEISLLAQEKRTATVFAMRDSLCLKLSEENYKIFEQNNIVSAFKMAKTSIKRLSKKKEVTHPGQNISIITVAPAGDSDHHEFVHVLHNRLSENYKIVTVTPEVCDEYFNKNMALSEITDESSYKFMKWIQKLEDEYRYIIFSTDRQMTPWTNRCLREADHIIFIADSRSHPALNSIELSYDQENVRAPKTTDMIFVHSEDTTKIRGSKEWLEGRTVKGYFHAKMGSKKDLDKIARIITEQSIGVVLNGGGARGYAHIGVLKAFEKCNIPIDYIGGTSMGALIASVYSLGGMEALIQYSEDFSKNYRGDYTFPFISLMKGRNHGHTFTHKCCLKARHKNFHKKKYG